MTVGLLSSRGMPFPEPEKNFELRPLHEALSMATIRWSLPTVCSCSVTWLKPDHRYLGSTSMSLTGRSGPESGSSPDTV